MEIKKYIIPGVILATSLIGCKPKSKPLSELCDPMNAVSKVAPSFTNASRGVGEGIMEKLDPNYKAPKRLQEK